MKRTTITLFFILALAVAVGCVQPPGSKPALRASDTPTAAPFLPTERVVTLIPQEQLQQTPSPTPGAPTTAPVPASFRLLDVRLFGQQTAWAIDDQGRILRSDAGVNAWKDVSPGAKIATAFFQDAARAYAIQAPPEQPAGQPPAEYDVVTWRTSDGGQTWTSVTWKGITQPETFGRPTQLVFLDDMRGWLYFQIYPGMMHCETAIYATEDGGASWQRVEISMPTDANPNPDTFLRGAYSLPYGPQVLSFVSDLIGFAGDGSLMATFDGGRDWREQALPQPENFPAAANPYIYVSPAWFSSPQEGVLLERVYDPSHVSNPPGDLFNALPLASYLFFTHNGGETWSPQPAPALVGWPYFLDAKTGWFLGKDTLDPAARTQLFATQDGGQTWTLVGKDTPLPLGFRIEFAGPKVGVAYDFYGTARTMQSFEIPQDAGASALFQTQDGGATWTPVEPRVSR